MKLLGCGRLNATCLLATHLHLLVVDLLVAFVPLVVLEAFTDHRDSDDEDERRDGGKRREWRNRREKTEERDDEEIHIRCSLKLK